MIYLSKGQIDELVEHSQKEAPNEACGILAGKEGKVDPSTSLEGHGERPSTSLGTSPEFIEGRSRTVEKVYQMANQDKSAKTFFMDPKEQLKVMKEIRKEGKEMVGIYHSHLEAEAFPSAHDVELAYYPDASYVIVSIKDKDNPKIRSFRIVEGKITEEEVKIV